MKCTGAQNQLPKMRRRGERRRREKNKQQIRGEEEKVIVNDYGIVIFLKFNVVVTKFKKNYKTAIIDSGIDLKKITIRSH